MSRIFLDTTPNSLKNNIRLCLIIYMYIYIYFFFSFHFVPLFLYCSFPLLRRLIFKREIQPLRVKGFYHGEENPKKLPSPREDYTFLLDSTSQMGSLNSPKTKWQVVNHSPGINKYIYIKRRGFIFIFSLTFTFVSLSDKEIVKCVYEVRFSLSCFLALVFFFFFSFILYSDFFFGWGGCLSRRRRSWRCRRRLEDVRATESEAEK